MQWDWGNLVLAMSALIGLVVGVLIFYGLVRSEQSVPAIPGEEAEPIVDAVKQIDMGSPVKERSSGWSHSRSHTKGRSSRGERSSGMNDCSSSIKLIYPYLDGELDTKGAALVQAHIRECAQCRETFAAEQEFLELVRVCARSSHNLSSGS